MRSMVIALSIASAGLAGSAAHADPVFRISETFVGLSGEDGTPDWIEVTNFGDMNGDTGELWYDDESQSVGDGVQLPSFDLSPGESAVFLVTDDVDEDSIDTFTDIWGAVPNLGAAAGGGGLSQGGDTASILLGDGTLVDELEYTLIPDENTATIVDPTGLESIALAEVGVLGAYESNPFFNDNIGGDDMMVTLVGSPGVVPEPAALALVAMVGIGALGRRRRG